MPTAGEVERFRHDREPIHGEIEVLRPIRAGDAHVRAQGVRRQREGIARGDYCNLNSFLLGGGDSFFEHGQSPKFHLALDAFQEFVARIHEALDDTQILPSEDQMIICLLCVVDDIHGGVINPQLGDLQFALVHADGVARQVYPEILEQRLLQRNGGFEAIAIEVQQVARPIAMIVTSSQRVAEARRQKPGQSAVNNLGVTIKAALEAGIVRIERIQLGFVLLFGRGKEERIVVAP